MKHREFDKVKAYRTAIVSITLILFIGLICSTFVFYRKINNKLAQSSRKSNKLAAADTSTVEPSGSQVTISVTPEPTKEEPSQIPITESAGNTSGTAKPEVYPIATPEEGGTENPDIAPEEGETENPDVASAEGEAENPDITSAEGEIENPDVTPEEGETESPSVTPEEGETEDAEGETTENPSVTPENGESTDTDETPSVSTTP